MPIDLRRRDDIAAAVDAYNRTHPTAPLPRNAARLLAVMFSRDDVCRQSLEALEGEGFSRGLLPGMLRLSSKPAWYRNRWAQRESRTPTGCCFRRRRTQHDPAIVAQERDRGCHRSPQQRRQRDGAASKRRPPARRHVSPGRRVPTQPAGPRGGRI